MQSGKKRIVFILGMHRSGTSLTSELVDAMGFSVPGTPLDVIDSVNAHGFWESYEVVSLNERILSSAELKWFHVCPVGHVFPNISDSRYREFSREICQFVDAESDRLGNLVIKDPRMCILWPMWFSSIDQDIYDIKVIYVNRHPASVAGSLRARDGFSLFSGHLLWMCYFFSVFGGGKINEILYLNYEELVSDVESARVISDFLGMGPLDSAVWNRIVDIKLQRNFDSSFPDKGFVYNLAKTAYSVIDHGSLVRGGAGLDILNADFERFLFENNDFVYALNESNNHLSDSRSELVSIGNMHSEALKTIREKEFSLFENAAYIASCHARIAELDIAMIEFDATRQKLQTVNQELVGLHEGNVRNTLYIAECEGRVFDLEISMREFVVLRSRLVEIEAVLAEKDFNEAHNKLYIDKLSGRIAELNTAVIEFDALRTRLAEVEKWLGAKLSELEQKHSYIEVADARILELDELFTQQRDNYLSALDVINQYERKLASRNDEFFSVVDETSILRDKLEGLLAWKLVKIIDRHITKREH